MVIYNLEDCLHQKPCLYLDLQLLASSTVRNKLLLFISHIVYRFLLQFTRLKQEYLGRKKEETGLSLFILLFKRQLRKLICQKLYKLQLIWAFILFKWYTGSLGQFYLCLSFSSISKKKPDISSIASNNHIATFSYSLPLSFWNEGLISPRSYKDKQEGFH